MVLASNPAPYAGADCIQVQYQGLSVELCVCLSSPVLFSSGILGWFVSSLHGFIRRLAIRGVFVLGQPRQLNNSQSTTCARCFCLSSVVTSCVCSWHLLGRAWSCWTHSKQSYRSLVDGLPLAASQHVDVCSGSNQRMLACFRCAPCSRLLDRFWTRSSLRTLHTTALIFNRTVCFVCSLARSRTQSHTRSQHGPNRVHR